MKVKGLSPGVVPGCEWQTPVGHGVSFQAFLGEQSLPCSCSRGKRSSPRSLQKKDLLPHQWVWRVSLGHPT